MPSLQHSHSFPFYAPWFALSIDLLSLRLNPVHARWQSTRSVTLMLSPLATLLLPCAASPRRPQWRLELSPHRARS